MIHIFQPALPRYRIDFFERLAVHYGSDIRVYYSPVDMGVLTGQRDRAAWEHPIGPILQPMHGVEWQTGALSVPIHRGDTVVVCGAPRNVTTLLVLAKARILGARTIWWGHYWSATSEARRHRIRMKLSRLAHAMLFYTDAEVSRFFTDGWAHAGPIGALNNGVNLTEIRKLRRAYNPEERGTNVLFIGRLTAKARLGLLIAALAEPALETAHLHILGDGEEEDTLRLQAASLGVVERITWYGGTTEEARIAEVANSCAAFVYPGQVGLSLIHAMSYGLPCIVHNQPLHHMPEIAAFNDGETGATFSEDDVVSLASETARLIWSPSLRKAFSKRCLDVTNTRFNTEHMAERFITLVKCVAT